MNNGEFSFIKNMFDSIAPKYDILNRLLSLRRDVYWRSTMVSKMNIPCCSRVLDVACGTGDVVVEIINQKGSLVKVTGVDFSENMLVIANEKLNKKFCCNVDLVVGNALTLPFTAKSFDAITVAFGVRNLQDRIRVLRSFNSLLKQNGVLLVLELATPLDNFLYKFFMYYFKRILPIIGSFVSKNSFAYTYLIESVIKFPKSETFSRMMIDAGFSRISCKRMTMGIANLFIGYKR